MRARQISFNGISGENTYTVGSGGRFATLDSALAWLATQSGSVAVSHPATTGDVTQYSDSVTNISQDLTGYARPGDLIYFGDDEAGAPNIYTIQNWAVPTYYPIYDLRATTARLMTGRVGATGTGVSIQLYRPYRYTLVLLPGYHNVSADVSLPDTAAVSFVGLDASQTFLSKSADANITIQRHGYLSIQNVTLYEGETTTTRSHTIFSENSATPFDAGFAVLLMKNIETAVIAPNASGTNDLIIFRGASAHISDIKATEGFVTIGTIKADLLMLDDVHLTSSQNHHCLALQLVHEYQCTKDWMISNLDLYRYSNKTGQTDYVLTMGSQHYGTPGATGGKKAFIRSSTFQDLDTNTDIGLKALHFDLSPSDVYEVYDCVIETTHASGSIADMTIEASGAATVKFHNVRNSTGGTPEITNSNPANLTFNNYTPYGVQSTAYAATITPDANLGGIVDIGALTGNITIGEPTNPISGQELTFIFEQDATGGRTITWNAVFKKAADGAGGASTKGVTSFRYDGTHWVQIGGALAWA